MMSFRVLQTDQWDSYGYYFCFNICNINNGIFWGPLLQYLQTQWGKEFQEFILENWSHILDKCQRSLDKNQLKSQELLEILNSVIEVIQFTMEFSDKKILLLDILVERDSTGIFMNLYHKPSDTQQCLLYSTSHPKHCLKKFHLEWLDGSAQQQKLTLSKTDI